ncbi:hypothetical protein BDP81DRAFT_61638 [Colletotrichum phormii]|uniref:Uncharacterized protein n=1 Tax=Colletotrichum phormii TaxID=359342 RepID=A0AAI9ZKT3_9PEZI|nr:uncharacterized protein BDP81DRAFT_61638 [Colletotrichum phormii]KAK1633830.1 hypothetical protein BDP81DRAFT_61638 [Colletotrichum phormii]
MTEPQRREHLHALSFSSSLHHHLCFLPFSPNLSVYAVRCLFIESWTGAFWIILHARQLGKSGHGIREGNLLSSNGRAKECPSSAFSGALVPLLSCLDHYVAGGPRGASCPGVMYGELTCGCGVKERRQVLVKEGSAVILGFLSVWKPAGGRAM